jgi:hypothetical protein
MVFPLEGWNDIYKIICEDLEGTDRGIFQGTAATLGRINEKGWLR